MGNNGQKNLADQLVVHLVMLPIIQSKNTLHFLPPSLLKYNLQRYVHDRRPLPACFSLIKTEKQAGWY